MRRTLIRTVVCALLMGSCLSLAAKSAREVAAERYKKAQVLLEDLDAVPSVELGERQYLLVVDALKSVHRATPASSYCDDALVAVGDVYASMIDRFGADPWQRKAVEAYQYAVQEYPHSKLIEKARAALRDLESGNKTTISKGRRPVDPDDEEEERAANDPRAMPKPAATRPPAPAPKAAAPGDAIVRPVSTSAANAPSDSMSAHPGQLENRAAETPASLTGGVASISAIRHYSHPGYTRIVIDADDYTPYKFDFLSRPSRLYFDLLTARLSGEIRRGVEIEVGDAQVARVRAAQNRLNKARVVLDLADEITYDISWLSNPPRLVIDLRGQHAAPETLARSEDEPSPSQAPAAPEPVREAAPEPVQDASIAAKPEPEKPHSFQEAFLALSAGRRPEAVKPSVEAAALQSPDIAARQNEASRVLSEPLPQPALEAEVTLAKAVVPDNAPPPRPAQATSRGNQSLIRALGLKIGKVVIDAGHGGHDTGMIGPTGLREKDVVLDVALRLGKLIESKLGAEVLYTRKDDRFLELSDRPKVANNAQADLFISVHANAYSSPAVRGVETFYLNFTADPWALKVASRENAASSNTVHELQDLLGKIAQKEKLDESREFALKMQSSVYGGLSKETAGLRNRGVRQAPLIVLIGAKMPAILTEIGFLSNPTDEKLFKSGAYRDKVAARIFDGIESYVKTLSSHDLTMTDADPAAASLD